MMYLVYGTILTYDRQEVGTHRHWNNLVVKKNPGNFLEQVAPALAPARPPAKRNYNHNREREQSSSCQLNLLDSSLVH